MKPDIAKTRFLGPFYPPLRHTCDLSVRDTSCECASAHHEMALRVKTKPGDVREDMKALLERMRQLMGEMDRLLERTK